MKTYYTTYGGVRMGCGHRHRSLNSAALCQEADQRACARAGGYTDRVILALDEDEARGLGPYERTGHALMTAEYDELTMLVLDSFTFGEGNI